MLWLEGSSGIRRVVEGPKTPSLSSRTAATTPFRAGRTKSRKATSRRVCLASHVAEFCRKTAKNVAGPVDFIYRRIIVTVLRQFLSRREAEILEQMKVLEKELAEIRAAWAALQSEAGVGPPRPSVTIKDMVRQILKGRPDGLRAKELLREIQDRFGVAIERTSLSPQLSRLREAGEITLQQGRWYSLQISLADLKPPAGKRTPESFEVRLDDLL